MNELRRAGIRLAYLDVGKGVPPLVFVHDLGADHTTFTQLVERFRRTQRVVAVDLRGHGQSGQSEAEPTAADHADDLAWLVYELGVYLPIVVGRGFGGRIALDLAVRYPDLPAAVVLLSSPDNESVLSEGGAKPTESDAVAVLRLHQLASADEIGAAIDQFVAESRLVRRRSSANPSGSPDDHPNS